MPSGPAGAALMPFWPTRTDRSRPDRSPARRSEPNRQSRAARFRYAVTSIVNLTAGSFVEGRCGCSFVRPSSGRQPSTYRSAFFAAAEERRTDLGVAGLAAGLHPSVQIASSPPRPSISHVDRIGERGIVIAKAVDGGTTDRQHLAHVGNGQQPLHMRSELPTLKGPLSRCGITLLSWT